MDYVVLTAATPEQASNYRALIAARVSAGLYPRAPAFRVYCDPVGGRVGSGGGTLLALHALFRDEAHAQPEPSANDGAEHDSPMAIRRFFASQRVLLIHAGGESRRLPCYVPEGKLFAPLAISSASTFTPVVLDVLLSLYLDYPWRRGETIMASGDVIVTFDTRLLGGGGGDNGGNHGDNNGGGGDGDGVKGACARGDLCGFGTATTLSQGSRHGVFACDASESATASAVLPVLDFLQKASEEELRRKALLPRAQRRDGSDGQGDHGDSGSDGEQCAVDTGIFSMSSEFVSALLAWAISPSEAAGPCALDQVRKAELYCDYYLEIVTACIPGLGVDEYIGRMVNGGSKLSRAHLQSLHAALENLVFRAAYLPATFLHFGSLSEFPAAVAAVQSLKLRPFYELANRDHQAIAPAPSSACASAIPSSTAASAPAPAAASLPPVDAVSAEPSSRLVLNSCGCGCDATGDTRSGGQIAMVEMCELSQLELGGANLVTGLRRMALSGRFRVPARICLDGRVLSRGRRAGPPGSGSADESTVLVYGCADSFKKSKQLADVIFCGQPIEQWLAERSLKASDIWSESQLSALANGQGETPRLRRSALQCICSTRRAGSAICPVDFNLL